MRVGVRIVAWVSASGAERADIDGAARRTLETTDWESSVDAIAIDDDGSIAVTSFSRSVRTTVHAPSGARRSVGVAGPPLAIRSGAVFGVWGSPTVELRMQAPDDATPTVLLRQLFHEDPHHTRAAIRFSPDGAVWLRSGRDDVAAGLTWMLPRIVRVGSDATSTAPYVATVAGGLGFDVDARSLITATNIAEHWSGVRIEELTHAGEPIRRVAWCPEYRGTPTARIDATSVWVLVGQDARRGRQLYRFPRDSR